jgi:hypothetical protein
MQIQQTIDFPVRIRSSIDLDAASGLGSESAQPWGSSPLNQQQVISATAQVI